MFRHEVPTHLGVVDKLILGLSARQLMLVLAGLTAAHVTWTHVSAWGWMPLVARAAMAAAAGWVFVIAALVRPHGRGLDEWAFAVARYTALPKVSVWQPASACDSYPIAAPAPAPARDREIDRRDWSAPDHGVLTAPARLSAGACPRSSR